MKVIRKIKRKISGGVKKCSTAFMRYGMKWYEADKQEHARSFKRDNYRLAQSGQLTQEKKQEILSGVFRRRVGYELNWNNPRSFNEKINWLRLNYQNPLVTRCCDKFSVKGYVTEILGPEFVVPTIDWWTTPDQIDFDKLPDKFVLKVNWSSGMNIIVPDKSKLDQDEVRKKLRYWTQPSQNNYYELFNWGYKYMSPVIYAEEYISEIGDSSQVYDYKFFCYDGVCKNLFITTDRFTHKTYNWFDRDFNELPFTYGTVGKTEGGVKKPRHYEDMIAWAEKLSKPFPFVRVDFYEIGDRVMVGEMTFYCGGGILAFHPQKWDFELGKNIRLPAPLHFDELRQYEAIEPKEAYMLEKENGISIQEKQHYCEQKGYAQLFYWPDLTHPRSFNEKLLWLALHYQSPVVARAVDKYEMKSYVSELVGPEYVVPAIGVYEDVNDIDWDALPEQFVAKSTAGWSGKQVVIVREKSYRNEGVFKARVAEWLYPWNTYRYENMCITDQKIKPRIIIEQLLGDGRSALVDYKFYCTYGEAKMALVVCDRKAKNQTRAFVDVSTWTAMPFRRRGIHKANSAPKPEKLDEMLGICKKLSAGAPLVRVDFYEHEGRIYVGEVSYDPGLFLRFEPVEWDFKLGEYIDLDRIDPKCLHDV